MNARGTQLTLLYAMQVAPDNLAMCHHCGDCDVNVAAGGERYMVRDEVWPIHHDGGLQCIGCLEARIGRRLTPEDFTDCPYNDPDDPWFGPRGRRLLDRLGVTSA
jgi:hypothetical protein